MEQTEEFGHGAFGLDEENVTGDGIVFIGSVEAAAGEEEVGMFSFLNSTSCACLLAVMSSIF
jgi:hypothetical protein